MTIIIADKSTFEKLTATEQQKIKKKIRYLTKKEASAWGRLLGNEAKGWGRAGAKVAGEFLSTKLR